MHPLLVETVPAVTERAFTVAFAILFSVVVQHVVLARNIENLFGTNALECLIERIEFRWLREVAQIARVKDKRRWLVESVNLRNGFAQRGSDVRVGRFVEANMTVANLDETQVALHL